MPRTDVNDDCRTDKSATKTYIRPLNGTFEKNPINPTLGATHHSPKVFAADSVTVNAPAKDVLGPKFDNFTRNLKQSIAMPAESTILTKINGTNGTPNGHLANGNGGLPKLQPLSACYDRYPKPGSYGGLQVYPMNGVNCEINNAKENIYDEVRQRDDIAQLEQDRLEEILKMCADFERQNQNVQSSPIVQNRIKTNGSLPREKKSPLSPDQMTTNVFFPLNSDAPSSPHTPIKSNTGYENVKLLAARKMEQPASSSRPTLDLHGVHTNGQSNGYENVMSPIKSPVGYVPQSPRTRIKTCISPKRELTSTPIQRKTDYDLLVQSFEEKLRIEIQQLRENRSVDNRAHRTDGEKVHSHPTPPPKPQQLASTAPTVPQYVNVNRTANLQEGIYGSLTNKHKSNHQLTVNIKKNLDDKQIAQLKKQQIDVLRKARDLKAQISELQRQEEEVLRELDLEKALVSAELSTEQSQLNEMEQSMGALQAKIHRLEAQRNANRVLQETQQNKLKQSIDMKQNQVEGLKKLIAEAELDDTLKDELNETIELLENDSRHLEDLEFQYLEEETEWLAYREELHNEQKTISRRIGEKRKHIASLEAQGIDNHNAACADTKNIEKGLLSMHKELEKYREELKTIDTLLYELSGEKNAQSDSDEDLSPAITDSKRSNRDIMSQSLFGSQEILANKQTCNDLMSKSVNENLFSNKIEMRSFDEVTKAEKDSEVEYAIIAENGQRHSTTSDGDCKENGEQDEEPTPDDDSGDPLQKLKYNLSPPFEHKGAQEAKKSANLNLSIESDDFEVNPLEKRVPSQDDIDRISKVTINAPISTQGASYKVIESIKEIERNRQLLLTQQGSHVIEHERQKMSELKKKSHDEARAQYMQLQHFTDGSYRNKNGSLEKINHGERKANGKIVTSYVAQLRDNVHSPRHSHPEYDYERPLSEANSEMSYDALSDKHFKSSTDICMSNHRIQADYDGSGGSQRGSMMSSENSESGRLTSGGRRNLPKHQRPLTRYLPIMSADLDLRLHIESAGHQVTLCPHVTIDSFSCRGYLHKLGATFHGWSKRWFVLDRQKMAFIYYSDKSERKPRGGAYFSTIDEVYLDHLNTSKSGRPHCTFIVKTKRRSYHLQAASDAAARIWIDAIITGAQGNIDY